MTAGGESRTDACLPEVKREPMVEALLVAWYPFQSVAVALAPLIGSAGTSSYHDLIDSERKRLVALPSEELERLHQRLRATQNADREAQAAKKAAKIVAKAEEKEAAKFYNLPVAEAKFEFWSKAEYWTFDESVALLLGKDPSVVTWAAVKAEKTAFSLAALSGQQQVADFVRRYEELRNLAVRATAMTNTTRLRPATVVVWAMQSGAAEVPGRLIELLQARAQARKALLPQPATAAPHVPPASSESEPPVGTASPVSAAARLALKRLALVKEYGKAWPSIERDLAHASENGLTAVAKGDKHGLWLVEPALAWARKNGKLTQTESREPASPFPTAKSTVHRFLDS
jgi:hypothetical protein